MAAVDNLSLRRGALLSGSCGSASDWSPDYFLCVCTAAIVPKFLGPSHWDCLRASKR